MKKIIFIFCFIIFWFSQAYAIPPPDFIIQIWSQLGVFFAMWVAIFSTVFGTSYFYLKDFYKRHKKIVFWLLLLIILGWFFLYKYLDEQEKLNNILLQNKNLDIWLSYKNLDIYNEYKWLPYEEKVKKLLEVEELELKKWLFDWKKSDILWKSISNEDFDNILKWNDSKYVFLDAREDIENDIWRIPWSIHHRVADLKLNSDFKKLSKDKTYIVICWWWMRWKLVSEFLISKWIKSKYLEWGVKEWIKYWWEFIWKTELKDVFRYSNYSNFLDDIEFVDNVISWTKLIDAREQSRLSMEDKVINANSISIMYSSSQYMENKFSEYWVGDRVVVICNDYVNCFDWQTIWIELEKRGVNLIWIYFKKWVVK